MIQMKKIEQKKINIQKKIPIHNSTSKASLIHNNSVLVLLIV